MKPRILCVDDEPRVLEGLELHLGRHFRVTTSTNPPEALQRIEAEAAEPFAVVLSDMRMPQMDGAAFLARARQIAPSTVRMLLTGQSDMTSAVAAVNEGQIFRFLTKPCPPDQLVAACRDAAEQHRLVTAEKVLLEQTLRGAVKVLADVLALASPAAFGRAMRLQRHVGALAERLGVAERWPIEVAATVSQIGCVALQKVTLDKMNRGEELSEAERDVFRKAPETARVLLQDIPRLEPVLEVLARTEQAAAGTTAGTQPPIGSRLLKVASDYDLLELQGFTQKAALEMMSATASQYDAEVLKEFVALLGSEAGTSTIRNVRLREIEVGMILGEDVRTDSGMLLVARGYEVTEGFLAHVRNFRPGQVREPIKVMVQQAQTRSGSDATQSLVR